MHDMKEKLSILWVFAVLNYLYADVIALFDPAVISQLMTGHIGSLHFTPRFLLGISIFMEIPILMVVLSRALPYRANRWANIIAGTMETAVVLTITYIAPMKNRTPPSPHYLFFGSIEIACTSLIVWYAWRWPRERSDS
jgi:MFS family permease